MRQHSRGCSRYLLSKQIHAGSAEQRDQPRCDNVDCGLLPVFVVFVITSCACSGQLEETHGLVQDRPIFMTVPLNIWVKRWYHVFFKPREEQLVEPWLLGVLQA